VTTSIRVFADTREASTYPGSYRGLLADERQSPHEMGGVPPGLVPMSVADKRMAERILEWRVELKAEQDLRAHHQHSQFIQGRLCPPGKGHLTLPFHLRRK